MDVIRYRAVSITSVIISKITETVKEKNLFFNSSIYFCQYFTV